MIGLFGILAALVYFGKGESNLGRRTQFIIHRMRSRMWEKEPENQLRHISIK